MNKNKIFFTFWKKNKDLTKLFNYLGKENLYFVGGTVRNALEQSVCDDIDIATNIKPQMLKKLLKKKKIDFFDFSKGHGTISIKKNNQKVEITSFRVDQQTDGRNAKTIYTNDIFKDSCRRDFTINAIYSDFNGNLYDPHKGIKDLNSQIIRFIGKPEKRIQEDNLRIVRYFRFIGEYSDSLKKIHQNSLKACVKKKLLINTLSKERVYQEFRKLLISKNASFALQILQRKNVLQIIVRDFNKIKYKDIKFVDKVHKDFLVRLAYLINKSKISIELAVNQLKLPKREKNELKILLTQHNSIQTAREARVLRYNYSKDIALKKYQLMIALVQAKEAKTVINVIKNWTPPQLPVNGKDLLQLGFKGNNIGKILKKLENWWIEKEFKSSREQCIKVLLNRKLFPLHHRRH